MSNPITAGVIVLLIIFAIIVIVLLNQRGANTPTPTPEQPTPTPDPQPEPATLTPLSSTRLSTAPLTTDLIARQLARNLAASGQLNIILEETYRVPIPGEGILNDAEVHLVSTVQDVLTRSGAAHLYTFAPKISGAALVPGGYGVIDLLIVTSDEFKPVLALCFTRDGRLPSITPLLRDAGIHVQALIPDHAVDAEPLHALMRGTGLNVGPLQALPAST